MKIIQTLTSSKFKITEPDNRAERQKHSRGGILSKG